MKIKDLTIGVFSLLFLISSIVVAVRPQSSMVQIEKNPSNSSGKLKVIREGRNRNPIETQIEKQNLPLEVDADRVAKKDGL